MDIHINQKPLSLPDGATVADALCAFGARPPFAVAQQMKRPLGQFERQTNQPPRLDQGLGGQFRYRRDQPPRRHRRQDGLVGRQGQNGPQPRRDALVVDVPRPGTEGWMPLFVVLREGVELDDELRREIARRIRAQCSPRHVPDEVFEITEVPRTLSGKVLEVPVKRILMGTPPEKVASRDSLANPEALDWFVEMAGGLDL